MNAPFLIISQSAAKFQVTQKNFCRQYSLIINSSHININIMLFQFITIVPHFKIVQQQARLVAIRSTSMPPLLTSLQFTTHAKYIHAYSHAYTHKNTTLYILYKIKNTSVNFIIYI